MTDNITLTGLVATAPRHITTGEGLAITSFRLASSQSRFDRATGSWVAGDTNWYTVTTFRRLAVSAASSISKGDRVIVSGRLRVRDWKSSDRSGTSMEVDADALGHDLTWGTAKYTRSISAATAAAAAAAEAYGAGAESAPDAGRDEQATDDSWVAAGIGAEHEAGASPVGDERDHDQLDQSDDDQDDQEDTPF